MTFTSSPAGKTDSSASPYSQPLPLEDATASLLKTAKNIADYAAHNAVTVDCIGGFPEKEFEMLAEAGLLVAPLDPHFGGLGLGFRAHQTWLLLQVLTEIGRGNLSLGRVYEGHVNALQLIQTFGTPEQVQGFVRDSQENKIFGVWNAEAEDGVTLLPLDSGRYRLEGCKTFCSGCGYVERPMVNGALPDGSWQICIVPMEQVEVQVNSDWWRPSGMLASASYKVDFSGIEITPDFLIGQPGDYFRQPWLTAGVVRFAAVQLGGAVALFDATRCYLQQMSYTEHPHQQARVAQMAIAIEQANLWLQGAATQVERYAPIFGGLPHESPQNPLQLVSYANMVRTAIEQVCMETMQLAERCIGTRGLLPPHPMERLIRDLTLYLRQPAFDAALTGVGEYVLSQPASRDQLWA